MKYLTFIWALMAAFVLSGCNTTAGFGEDVEATGEGVQSAAENTEKELEDAFD